MSIRAALFACAQATAEALALPPVARVLMPDPRPAPDRDAEFGLIELAGGACGLYYAWLGAAQAELPARFAGTDFAGMPALALARLALSDGDAPRSLGIAAINAMTEQLYRVADFEPEAATDAMAGLVLGPGDHLGMIGNFAPLVRLAQAQGIRTSVVERKAHMQRDTGGVRITLDPAVLRDCNKIICTGATLLNDTLDAMLGYCSTAEHIALIGPTVGFFPDAVFDRGVDVVAGTRVVDASLARARLASGHKLGDSARRTLIRRNRYPGFESLLQRALGLRDAGTAGGCN